MHTLIIKTSAEIKEIENRKVIEKLTKIKYCSFERSIKFINH